MRGNRGVCTNAVIIHLTNEFRFRKHWGSRRLALMHFQSWRGSPWRHGESAPLTSRDGRREWTRWHDLLAFLEDWQGFVRPSVIGIHFEVVELFHHQPLRRENLSVDVELDHCFASCTCKRTPQAKPSQSGCMSNETNDSTEVSGGGVPYRSRRRNSTQESGE